MMRTRTHSISLLLQRTSLFLFVLIFPALPLAAQSFSPTNIYSGWNGSSAFATVPTAPGLTFSQVSRGPGISSGTPVTSGITSNGWDGANSLAAAEAANKYFTFSITSNTTNAFSVTSVLFALQRSSTGPQNFQLEYSVNAAPFALFGNPASNTSTNAFVSTSTAASPVFVPGGQNIVFRLYAWNASGPTGTFRINNNTAINGSVYTLPTTSVTGAPFCVNASAGAPANVNYSSTGSFTAGNVFTAQLSNASGSFASPVNIGTLPGNSASGTISAVIPAGTPHGSGYRIRVVSTSPAIDGVDNGSNIIIGGVAISTTVTNLSCNAAGDGAITSNIVSGTGPFTYSWSTSATTPGISGLAAGIYSLTVTDNAGCTTSSSATITEPAAIVTNLSATAVLCHGGANGQITLTVSGGNAPYSYLWSNNATTQNLSALTAGNYSVAVTDNQGCVKTDSVVIVEPAILAVIASATNVSCGNGSDGAVTLSVNGGTGPYSFSWSNSATTQNISALAAGTYSVIVTDANGCTQNASATVNGSASPITLSVIATPVNCNGGNNGAANLAVSGGSGPFTFAWNNSAGTEDITGLVAGTYSVIVTDNNGCTQSSSVTVTEPAVISIASSTTNVNCNGGTNGAANLTVSGGTSPYTYAWSNSAITQNISGLGAGTYSVIVTDNHGCAQNASVTITQPPVLSVSSSSTNVNCNGGTNGAATLSVSGGTSPYTYAWSNSATTQNISALAAGTYSVIVTDNHGCAQNASVTITQPPVLAVSSSSTNVNCNGGTNGAANLSVSGGTSPYTYAWSNSAITQNISGLAAGTYSVIVTDNHGCAQNASVTITQPSVLAVSPSSTNVNCNGGTNGTANLSVSGGTSPYTYAWSNSANTQTISGLAAGTYSVIVTDNQGCAQNASVTITQPAAISVSSSSTSVNCNGGTDGTAAVSVSGGAAPYTYSWNNSATTSSISNLAAGAYSVVVTDNNGCVQNASVIITQPFAIGITAAPVHVSCGGDSSGAVSLVVNGGAAPYQFLWSNSATTQSLSALAAGTYSVIVTDNNGCSQNASVTLTEPSAITSSSVVVNASCGLCADGTIDLTVNGGSGSYTYAWSNSANTEDLNGLVTAMYYVTITDGNGCQHQDSAHVDFSTGIANVTANAFNVYPNPSTGENIHFDIASPGLALDAHSLRVTDMNGKAVYETALNNGTGNFQLDLQLPAGIYMYKIENGTAFVQSGQLVIVK